VAMEEPSKGQPLSYRLLSDGNALIDLHGFPVEVALIAVQVALEDILRDFPAQPERGGGGSLIIVTGRGAHSHGGIPLIKNAVKEFISETLRIGYWELAGRVIIPAKALNQMRGVPQPVPR